MSIWWEVYPLPDLEHGVMTIHLWIAILLGCSPPTPPDPVEALVEAWKADPDSVPDRLMAITDPEARFATLSALLVAHPEIAAGVLCEKLPDGPEREQCSRTAARPHLWSEAPAQAPSGRTHPTPTAMPSPLADVVAVASDCAGQRACVMKAAATAGGKGDVERAAGLCRGLDGARWAEECTFRAAERVVSGAAGLQRYPDAVSLCALSGDFIGDCLAHLHAPTLRLTPEASAEAAAWDSVKRNAERVQGFWASTDPTFARQTLDRMWVASLLRAYSGVREITGDPLDALPADAAVHVRSAAALSWMLRSEPESLAEAVEAVEAALLVRRGKGRRKAGSPPSNLPDFWPPGLTTTHAGVAYPGRSRRARSEDVSIDLHLAVLEAAARTDPPKTALLTEGLEHESAVVQWTAERLQARETPENP